MIQARIALLGHKDHGKSTLLGQLLIKTGSVSRYRVDEALRVSRELGRKFEPGFILDSFLEEREQAMTIDTTRAQVSHGGSAFEFIDVPGHEELLTNMLSGASYADTAVVLVSAAKGEGVTAQTKRHVYLARLLGIESLVVAVNKMDVVGYSKEAFTDLVNPLSSYLSRIGFAESSVDFVPISAYEGENLVEPSKFTPWYKGKPLLDTLVDACVVASSSREAALRKALRVYVQGVIDQPSTVGAKVLSGEVTVNSRLRIIPSGGLAVPEKVWVNGRPVEKAQAGDSVGLQLKVDADVGLREVVLVGAGEDVSSSKEFSAELFFIRPVDGGLRLVRLGWQTEVTGFKVVRVIDPVTGEPEPMGRLGEFVAAEAVVETDQPSLFEPPKKTKELGRFVLEDSRGLVAVGIVQ